MRVVMPSLGYADVLAATLPAWRALLPAAEFRIVTSAADTWTQAVARAAGATPVVTSAWTDGSAVFNKGGALDEGFGFVAEFGRPAPGEICLSLDADVYPVGRWPGDEAIHDATIHGCARRLCRTSDELNHYLQGRLGVEAFPLIAARKGAQAVPELLVAPSPEECERAAQRTLGYCQAFRYRSGLRFGWSSTAGGCDNVLARQFSRRGALAGLTVLHLGEPNRDNWRGRVAPPWGVA